MVPAKQFVLDLLLPTLKSLRELLTGLLLRNLN